MGKKNTEKKGELHTSIDTSKEYWGAEPPVVLVQAEHSYAHPKRRAWNEEVTSQCGNLIGVTFHPG